MKARPPTNPPDAAPPALRGVSRGAILVAGAVLFLVITLSYAGPSWAIALLRLLTDGAVVLMWLGAATGIGLLVVSSYVIAAALGLGVISLLVLGLGLIGALNGATAWIIVGVGLIALAVRVMPRRSAVQAWLRERAEWSWPWLLIVPFIAIATVAALMPPGILWSPDDPHPYDVVEYHLQIPREWYEAGRIAPLTHNVFSYFPFNVEMQYLLAMHLRGGPWAGMYVAQLMHVAYAALSVVAVYSMAKQWAGRVGATLAALAAAAAPWVWVLAPVGYNECGLLLYGTLAIGQALQALLGDEGRVRKLALAGAMAGFACGVKLTAGPLLLAGIPVALVVATRGRAPWKGLILFVVTGLLTFAPWLMRNVIWTGNPVFPEAQSMFGRAHFSETQSERWRRAHAAAPEQLGAVARVRALGGQIVFDWRYGFTLLPLALVAAAVDRSPRAVFLLTMLAILTVFWVGFTHLQGRFFVLAIPVAAMLVASLERWRWPAAGVLACVLVTSFVMLNVRLASYLYAKRSMVVALGVDSLGWAKPAVVQDLPEGTPVALAGDARAFLYDIPMSRLRYRTVFDVDVKEGGDVIDAWVRGSAANSVIVVDPVELARFTKTYYAIPAPDPEVARRSEPFILDPNEHAR